jgi:hypothetical protein
MGIIWELYCKAMNQHIEGRLHLDEICHDACLMDADTADAMSAESGYPYPHVSPTAFATCHHTEKETPSKGEPAR